jgi:hypothetical protein
MRKETTQHKRRSIVCDFGRNKIAEEVSSLSWRLLLDCVFFASSIILKATEAV